MLIGLVLLVALLTVPLTGGTFARLAEVRFAATPAIVTAIAIQVAVVSVVPGGAPAVHDALHVISYAFAGWFVVANRGIAGVLPVALGGALNLLAIAANGGVMPASRSALHAAGLPADTAAFANSAALAHPRLAWLGDVFATPGHLFFSNVFSVGDVVLALGAFVLLHNAARGQGADPSAGARRGRRLAGRALRGGAERGEGRRPRPT
jgi:Family of unknown function (DUF5317)